MIAICSLFSRQMSSMIYMPDLRRQGHTFMRDQTKFR